ncbi:MULTISPECIES: hypothetical protein [Providencia]|uniref:hypothetical protein n=1 Tax=Providencia TaxID=586 RepID=UPI001A1A98B4|nr:MULTISPECIES: hypothetical protein [Providencia]MDX4118995.1 hypothetical protein [Providencia rettgeri]
MPLHPSVEQLYCSVVPTTSSLVNTLFLFNSTSIGLELTTFIMTTLNDGEWTLLVGDHRFIQSISSAWAVRVGP